MECFESTLGTLHSFCQRSLHNLRTP